MNRLFLYGVLYFFYFLGHGAYFSTLSPYMIERFTEDARYVFLAGQLTFPAGYFLAGYLSDRTRKLRSFFLAGIILHAPCQFLLYSGMEFSASVALSAVTRFLFAFNMQMLTIATLEGASASGFAKSRTVGTIGFLLIHAFLFAMELFWVSFPGFELEDPGRGGRAGAFFLVVLFVPALFMQKDRLSSLKYYFKDAIAIAKTPRIFLFYLLSFVFFTSYQIVDFYLGAYLKIRGGMSYVYGGWILAVSLEIVLLPLTYKLHRGNLLFYTGLSAGILRFALLFTDAAVSPLEWILYSQLLHGIHFTCYYMGAIYRLREHFPDHLYGTGYGMYMAFSSALGQITGNLSAGYVLGMMPDPQSPSAYAPLFAYSIIIHIIVFAGFHFTSRIGQKESERLS